MFRIRQPLAVAGLLSLTAAATACTSSSHSATPSGSPVASSAAPDTSSLEASAPADSQVASSAAPVSSGAAPTSPGAAPSTTSTSTTSPSPTPTVTAKPSPTSTVPVVFYTPYSNARYGFTADIPASFKATAPPEDGDGLGYTGGRATLAVFGSNNVNGDSPAKVESELVAAVTKAGGKVTYKAISGNIVAVSGTESLAGGSTVVYTRTVVGVGSENTMRWSYPAGEVRTYDPQVMHTIIDFHPGNVDVAH